MNVYLVQTRGSMSIYSVDIMHRAGFPRRLSSMQVWCVAHISLLTTVHCARAPGSQSVRYGLVCAEPAPFCHLPRAPPCGKSLLLIEWCQQYQQYSLIMCQ